MQLQRVLPIQRWMRKLLRMLLKKQGWQVLPQAPQRQPRYAQDCSEGHRAFKVLVHVFLQGHVMTQLWEGTS